ncbi:integral membrane protein 2B-like isoform X2 [Penaeus japonicus]|uniref:integral membrane protein 2B-like isoform X1 n=1 Tax=Penaeus japonicus TaxID=27405 RepID=UPI001C70F3F2|nr:integral membrane protein 2B-like isoform X1 [Penaeus japonicus]XP_042887473.1 integral membrane protein 2B-like isoform X2 [Penaeus japonicus]
MTIVTKPSTKPSTEKKAEKTLGKPLVANETPGGEYVDHTVLDPTNDDVEAWLSSSARRRVSTATTICVFITALLVMSVGIIGGVYLYRQFSHNQKTRFRGWCGIPYERDALQMIPERFPADGTAKTPQDVSIPREDEHLTDAEYVELEEEIYATETESVPKPVLESEPESSQRGPDSPYMRYPEMNLFKEEFELDLDDDSFEQIHVPDFGFGHEGKFLHDFRTNKTAIIDVTSKRCFVMALNRSRILPPRTMVDLVRKMWMGYYYIDTEVVRDTMRVVHPPLKDYDSLGLYISNSCMNYRTYMLERVHTPELRKRSVDAQNEEQIQLVEFAGKKIIQYIILDSHEDSQQ